MRRVFQKKGSSVSFIFLFFLLSSLFLTSTLFVQAVRGQEENQPSDIRSTLSYWSGWWWMLFVVGILLIVFGLLIRKKWTNISKFLLYIGLFSVFISIFLVEILYVLPPLSGTLNLFKGDITLVNCENVQLTEPLSYIACLFAGHSISAKNLWLAWAIWFVFVFALPLSILFSLFWMFSDFIDSTNIRRVITFAAALLAYRVLMSTFFIELLSYGFGGIALLLINWLFFAYAVRWVRGMFVWVERVEYMREVESLAQLNRIEEQIANLRRAWEEAVKTGNLNLAENLEKQIKALESERENLAKRIKSTRPPS